MLACFSRGRGDVFAIYIYSLKEQKADKLSDNFGSPTWLSDSKRMLALKDDKFLKLQLFNTETKQQRDLLQLPKRTGVSGLAISSDDSEIFFMTTQATADIWLLRVE
jgi:hypothetical protein